MAMRKSASRKASQRAATHKGKSGSAGRAAAGTTSRAQSKLARAQDGGTATKSARVLAMLRGSDGATIAAIMAATGWQQHSVRGFFAGVVRKKLRLNLVSTKVDGARIYRIVRGKAATA